MFMFQSLYTKKNLLINTMLHHNGIYVHHTHYVWEIEDVSSQPLGNDPHISTQHIGTDTWSAVDHKVRQELVLK